MKIFRVLALATLLSPSITSADTVSDARELFAQWQPTSVTLESGGVLRVVLSERRITDTIYYAIIQAGFCLGPLFGQNMTDVRSVFILNSNQTQGWLFGAGASACERINNAPLNLAKILVAGQSSVHTDSANGL